MYENLSQPCISKPTRIVNNQNPTLIDNIFVNTIESPVCGNLINKISDHLPNFIIVENQNIKEKIMTNMHRRATGNYNPITFQNELVKKFSAKYNTSLSTDELSTTIITTFQESLENNSPMKLISRRKGKLKQNPWITQGILKSIRTKTFWYKKFMRSKDANCYNQYKVCRDRLNSVIKTSKKLL